MRRGGALVLCEADRALPFFGRGLLRVHTPERFVRVPVGIKTTFAEPTGQQFPSFKDAVIVGLVTQDGERAARGFSGILMVLCIVSAVVHLVAQVPLLLGLFQTALLG